VIPAPCLAALLWSIGIGPTMQHSIIVRSSLTLCACSSTQAISRLHQDPFDLEMGLT
jgi:hypothetical protein